MTASLAKDKSKLPPSGKRMTEFRRALRTAHDPQQVKGEIERLIAERKSFAPPPSERKIWEAVASSSAVWDDALLEEVLVHNCVERLLANRTLSEETVESAILLLVAEMDRRGRVPQGEKKYGTDYSIVRDVEDLARRITLRSEGPLYNELVSLLSPISSSFLAPQVLARVVHLLLSIPDLPGRVVGRIFRIPSLESSLKRRAVRHPQADFALCRELLAGAVWDDSLMREVVQVPQALKDKETRGAIRAWGAHHNRALLAFLLPDAEGAEAVELLYLLITGAPPQATAALEDASEEFLAMLPSDLWKEALASPDPELRLTAVRRFQRTLLP